MVVVKKKDTKASQAGYRDEILWTMLPIAEGGPEIYEPGDLEVRSGLSGRRRTGKDKKKRAGDKQDDDGFTGCVPLHGGHEKFVAILLNKLTGGQLLT